MTSGDLTERQAEALHTIVDRHRRYVERVYARCLELGFPQDDPFRMECRRAVLAYRELALAANDGRADGVSRLYLKRAKAWGAV